MVKQQVLRRELGLWGAVVMGLGSIVGTGVFVSIGIAAGIAGSGVVLAVAVAALVAIANGLSSAQLAANHPVSGGTYEYGYRYLNPWLGFTAGGLFLVAKAASAATAALGLAGYLLSASGGAAAGVVPIALVAVVALTLVVLGGVQRTHQINQIILGITVFSLLVFVISGLPLLIANRGQFFVPLFTGSQQPWGMALCHATALMFVAYTGYGRIATMGEEVRHPRQTIPLAIIVTLGVAMLLYLAVAIVAIGAVGADVLSQEGSAHVAPLAVVAHQFWLPGSAQILAVGALTAMLGVLLNLIQGLSRVVLAMGRRGDLPVVVARLNSTQTTPTIAVLVVGGAIALLVLIGNVKTTWSFSAFNVLVYYALTNWAALRLSPTERLYPQWIAWVGLGSCGFLAFWVEWQIWLWGLGLIGLGLAWKAYMGSRSPLA
jgi:basic amino acid/polyamine antiporter, APA family